MSQASLKGIPKEMETNYNESSLNYISSVLYPLCHRILSLGFTLQPTGNNRLFGIVYQGCLVYLCDCRSRYRPHLDKIPSYEPAPKISQELQKKLLIQIYEGLGEINFHKWNLTLLQYRRIV